MTGNFTKGFSSFPFQWLISLQGKDGPQEGKVGESVAPAILSQASVETANEQKKSVFKRFAAKFKT